MNAPAAGPAPAQPPFPALFIGHGTPMHAIEPGPYPQAWRQLGLRLPRPQAILAISAHWYTRGTAVTAMTQPRTIHDFGGFPPELFACQYPAPGDPALAARVRALLAPLPVHADHGWGLDHGSWSVLLHMYPQADIPVLQLSIDGTRPAAAHHAIGRALRPLRNEGVLLLGTGNIVHNLRAMTRVADAPALEPARQFDALVRDAILRGDDAALIDYATAGPAARFSVPTPEHYLPLLYILGARHDGEALDVPIDGIEMGSLSMLSVQVGGARTTDAPKPKAGPQGSRGTATTATRTGRRQW